MHKALVYSRNKPVYLIDFSFFKVDYQSHISRCSIPAVRSECSGLLALPRFTSQPYSSASSTESVKYEISSSVHHTLSPPSLSLSLSLSLRASSKKSINFQHQHGSDLFIPFKIPALIKTQQYIWRWKSLHSASSTLFARRWQILSIKHAWVSLVLRDAPEKCYD